MAIRHNCEIYIWSRIGHCPITHREGAYCDTLLHRTVRVDNPEHARQIVMDYLHTIPHANDGHYNIPTWWNQNKRSDRVGKRIDYLG